LWSIGFVMGTFRVTPWVWWGTTVGGPVITVETVGALPKDSRGVGSLMINTIVKSNKVSF